jgi:hypothetical protein
MYKGQVDQVAQIVELMVVQRVVVVVDSFAEYMT